VFANCAERLQEALCLLGRLEPLHRPFALPHRSMRVLGSVVQSLVTTVISMWHRPLDGGHITRQLVGDNDPRLDATLRVEHSTQEALCGVLVASTLNHDPTRSHPGRRHATASSRTTYIGMTFGQLVVIGVGAVLVLQQSMTVGTLIGFIGLLMGVGGSLSGCAAALPEWLRAIAGMRRVDDILREEPQVRDRPGAFALAPLNDEIRLERVAFSYAGQREALRGIDLTIPRGQTVALVGRSGSGKSTVFNLLTRFYEASDGVVSVDGHDLRHVTQDSLRAQMGVVFQDAFLFKGSVGDNIRLGKPDATFSEIENAARAAQIHDLIASWPNGYDAPVGENGGHLSGGQRQRVALARALIRNPGILLLDEATSALDTATEAAFNQTLRQLSLGRTIVQVTHRLAGVVDADRIYVLEGGQVGECGTHPQLLAQRGPYADLWRQQFGRSSLRADRGRTRGTVGV
jgi:ATP-binding cassette, subfamily B, bacterial